MGNRRKTAAALTTIIALAVLIVPSVVFIDSAVKGMKNLSAKMESGSLSIPASTGECIGVASHRRVRV